MRQQVVLETTGYARGRQVLDQRLKRVRIEGEAYREAKPGATLDGARIWLQAEGYELTNTVRPRRSMGTVVVRYFYEK